MPEHRRAYRRRHCGQEGLSRACGRSLRALEHSGMHRTWWPASPAAGSRVEEDFPRSGRQGFRSADIAQAVVLSAIVPYHWFKWRGWL
jgi:hypothetical protein